MAMVVPGPFVGVVVDSGLHLGRPRLLAVPMGVRLPAGVPFVASLGAGALQVAGECPSRGRRSVLAAAAGNGLSSAVLPDYASNGAGLFFGSAASSGAVLFFGSGAASSVALVAGSRAAAGRASRGGVFVVAATAGSPADGGVGDDPTPAEIGEEEQWFKDKKQWFKDKEQWMKDGEKYILGWNAEDEKQIKNREQWIKDGEKYIFVLNAEEEKEIKNWEKWIKDSEKYIFGSNAESEKVQARICNVYQEWLLLPRVDDASEKEEVAATVTEMFSAERIQKLIRDFNPEDVATDDTSLVCKEKGLIEFFGRALICGARHLELFMRTYETTSENYQGLVTLGKELKVAATECQIGYLRSESLDRALVAMIGLMGLPADSLDQFDIRVRLLQRRGREFAVDNTEQATTYFIIMAAYTHDVMIAVIKRICEIYALLVEHYMESST